ncbi:MAG: hypothetical protein R3F61_20455 [Myxococcota bacterium]
MTTDRYTRAVLTVIAAALSIIALRGLSPIPAAWATETMECRFGSPVELRSGAQIRVTDTVQVRMSDEVKVRVESYGAPGSSSSSPLYVKQID